MNKGICGQSTRLEFNPKDSQGQYGERTSTYLLLCLHRWYSTQPQYINKNNYKNSNIPSKNQEYYLQKTNQVVFMY